MKRKYLFIHCTASVPSSKFDADTLRRLHIEGRGWKQVGYQHLVMTNGNVASFTLDDGDGSVDPWEITNGAAGHNSTSRHICYVGGLGADGKSKNTLSLVQALSLCLLIRLSVLENPDILILGHNQVANKACPSFSVPKFIKWAVDEGHLAGVTAKNISPIDVYGYAAKLDFAPDWI